MTERVIDVNTKVYFIESVHLDRAGSDYVKDPTNKEANCKCTVL